MPIAAITRLRIRSLRFAPLLFWRAFHSLRQARAADGCLAADVRTIRGRVFWTRTLWRDTAAMRQFMASGAHGAVMPKLQHWCDEAAVAQWDADTLPQWPEAEVRLREQGRVSRGCGTLRPHMRAARQCRAVSPSGE